jgi:hypothetical protein
MATEELVFTLVASIAAVCGASAGRIFAVEAEDRTTAVLAAAYVGAGAGLIGAPPTAFLLTVIAKSWNSQAGVGSILFDATVTATTVAMLWGTIAGAAGGLVVGAIVATFKPWLRKRP